MSASPVLAGSLAGATGNPPAGGAGVSGSGASAGLTRTNESGTRRQTLLSTIFTSKQDGMLGDCYVACPQIGAYWTDGLQPGGFVMEAYVTPKPGTPQIGTLTVVTEYRNGNPIYEVDWHMIEKDIRANAYFRSGGTKPLTQTDLANIAMWLGNQTSDFTIPGGTALSANAQACAGKISSGTPSYYVFAPIARRITNNWLLLTVGNNLGTYSTSQPFPGAPTGYQWLKVTDRGRKEGAYWERTEEWMGADLWDADLYSTA